MTGLLNIRLFHNEFNKFSNARAQMLDSIYHMTLKLLKNYIFGVKMSRSQSYNGRHNISILNL